MRLCFAQPMGASPGRNFPGCAAPKVISGSRAPAGCVSTRLCWTQGIRRESSSRSRRLVNKGLKSQCELPDPDAEVGHCVHRIAMHESLHDVLYMQKHWDVMRSDDGGGSWREVSGDLPTDFGFPIGVHAHEPETVYVV